MRKKSTAHYLRGNSELIFMLQSSKDRPRGDSGSCRNAMPVQSHRHSGRWIRKAWTQRTMRPGCIEVVYPLRKNLRTCRSLIGIK